MLFSSVTFIWLFLPIVIIVNYILPQKFRNLFLLLASLLFYSWGEPIYIFLMIASITFNYVMALWIDRASKKRVLLAVCILVDIGLLWYFKYFETFATSLNSYTHRSLLAVREIALSLGISFYTFQILSYVIDVYLKNVMYSGIISSWPYI